MTPFKLAAILATLLGGAGPVHAAVVTVANPTTFGGFESNVENPTGPASTWTLPTASQWAPSKNFSAAALTIADEGASYAGTYEGLVTTSSDTKWQYIGLQNLAVQAGATINVQLYVWANDVGDALGISYGTTGNVTVTTTPTQVYSLTAAQIDSGWYVPVDFSFVAPSSDIDIDFGFLDAESYTPIDIDNVSVSYDSTDPVPEPASAVLLGAALLGLGLARRRYS